MNATCDLPHDELVPAEDCHGGEIYFREGHRSGVLAAFHAGVLDRPDCTIAVAPTADSAAGTPPLRPVARPDPPPARGRRARGASTAAPLRTPGSRARRGAYSGPPAPGPDGCARPGGVVRLSAADHRPGLAMTVRRPRREARIPGAVCPDGAATSFDQGDTGGGGTAADRSAGGSCRGRAPHRPRVPRPHRVPRHHRVDAAPPSTRRCRPPWGAGIGRAAQATMASGVVSQ